MAHPAASLTGGRHAYTGRDRREVGHRGAVVGDVVAPAGERGLDYTESLSARSPLQDGAARPAGAECHFSNQCRGGKTSRRITGKYFGNGPAYLHACTHADLRKSRKEKRKWCTGEIPAHRNGHVKKMNIMQEEERRVAHKAPKTARPRRAGAHPIPRWAYLLFAVLAVLVLLRSLQRGVGTSGTAQAPVRPVTV